MKEKVQGIFMIKCVLFDFDGVIADTETSNFEYYRKAFLYFGVELSDEDINKLIGTVVPKYEKVLLARAPRPVTHEELAKKKAEIGNTYEDGELCPAAGVKELIAKLRRRGIRTAIVSSTYTKLIVTALNRMGMTDLFDLILCGDMYSRAKPDPEGYLTAMRYLNAEPEECVVVEDSPNGIQAGKSSGAYVIAYAGNAIKQDVSRADRVISSFEPAGQLADEMMKIRG